MRRWGITFAFSAACIMLLAVLYKGFGGSPHDVPFKLAGKPAPPFVLRPVGGGPPVSIAGLKGKPVVINFWATWCGPCKMEHPVLEWGQQQFGEKVHFLGILFEDTEESARDYLWKNGASYTQLYDPRSGTAVDYGAAGVPETYFIDAKGIIAQKYVGPISPQLLSEKVTALLSGKPTAAAEATP